MTTLTVGSTYQSNSDGPYTIIEDRGWRDVTILFPSGYRYSVRREDARDGTAKDRFKPTAYGVGFIGGKKYSSGGDNVKAYACWKHMLARCYCPSTQSKNPTYIGCTVDKVWWNYQVFAEFYYKHYFEGAQIDKDIIVPGNQIYTPEMCIFVTHQQNVAKAQAKTWRFISPKGEVVSIYNLSLFCEKNGLDLARMYSVAKGVTKSCDKWTKVV